MRWSFPSPPGAAELADDVQLAGCAEARATFRDLHARRVGDYHSGPVRNRARPVR